MENVRKDREFMDIQRFLDKIGMTSLAALGLVALAILPFIPPFNKEYLIRWLIVGVLTAAQALAFDFTGGYLGIFNFGFSSFFGLGAYTSAISVVKFGLPPWVGMFIGISLPAFLGFLTGILTLRLRGVFAAIVTYFIGLALMGVATKWVSLTKGPLGFNCPALLETASNAPYFYIILSMMVVIYIVLKWMVRSPMGLAFKAIGQNMDAARTSGISPVRYRVINFTVSCAVAGWLGGFYAHYYGVLMPDVAGPMKGLEIFVIVFIGGKGSLWGGAFVATPFVIALELVRSFLSKFPGLNHILYGLFLILIMIYYPGGCAQLYQSLYGRARNRLTKWFINKE